MAEKMQEIGELIEQLAKEQNLTPTSLAKKVNMTPQNIRDIYKRTTIDSELLSIMSEALNYNLFTYYDDKEPIKTFRQKEIDEWQSKIDVLSAELDSIKILLETKDQLISKSDKRLLDQEDIIRLLKEKEDFLKK